MCPTKSQRSPGILFITVLTASSTVARCRPTKDSFKQKGYASHHNMVPRPARRNAITSRGSVLVALVRGGCGHHVARREVLREIRALESKEAQMRLQHAAVKSELARAVEDVQETRGDLTRSVVCNEQSLPTLAVPTSGYPRKRAFESVIGALWLS